MENFNNSNKNILDIMNSFLSSPIVKQLTQNNEIDNDKNLNEIREKFNSNSPEKFEYDQKNCKIYFNY